MSRKLFLEAAAISVAAMTLSCAGGDRSAPTTATPVSASTRDGGSVTAKNVAPALVVRTIPPFDGSNTITGSSPLTVTFGLCQSSDADAGDSLNWQFNFGDSGRPAFNPNGTFNPDWEHQCSAQHVYKEGVYTAWVSVTDKHLEDQGKGVSSLARKSQSFVVKVGPPAQPTVPRLIASFSDGISAADPKIPNFDGAGRGFANWDGGFCQVIGAYAYKTHSFTHRSGRLRVDVNANFGTYNGIFKGSFDPASPCQNVVALFFNPAPGNSSLEADLPAADYVVAVQTFASGATGSYTVNVNELQFSSRGVTQLSAPAGWNRGLLGTVRPPE